MLMTSAPTFAAPATRAQLHRLLADGLALSATYRGALSSHLPMGQQALLELGASAERLQAWTEAETAHLEPQPGGRPARIDVGSDLGRPGSDPAWRAHFGAAIAAHGADATLHEALALLLPGAGAAAFHGLIRTAHAVLADHPGELAAGLAHWAAQWLPLPASASMAPLPMADWVAGLTRLVPSAPPPTGLIMARMRAWGAAPGFTAVAGRLAPTPQSLRDIALLAARTYATSGNFTVLHLLTASHAMHVLQRWWPAPELAPGFTTAAAAGLLASGATPALQLDHPPSRPWPALISAACAQDDAHIIKLTHAAWRLDRCWPDPAWRRAAERAIPF